MIENNTKFVTVREAAELLGMSVPTVHRYIKNGILEARQIVGGGRWRVLRKSVEQLLNEIDQ